MPQGGEFNYYTLLPKEEPIEIEVALVDQYKEIDNTAFSVTDADGKTIHIPHGSKVICDFTKNMHNLPKEYNQERENKELNGMFSEM